MIGHSRTSFAAGAFMWLIIVAAVGYAAFSIASAA